MDALWTEMLKGLFTLSPGFAAAAVLIWWTLKTTREREDSVRADTVQREVTLLAQAGKREEEMRTASNQREVTLQAAADRRESRLLDALNKLADQYERVAVVLGQQAVALGEGANTLENIVREMQEMRREHNRIIGKDG